MHGVGNLSLGAGLCRVGQCAQGVRGEHGRETIGLLETIPSAVNMKSAGVSAEIPRETEARNLSGVSFFSFSFHIPRFPTKTFP